MKHKTYSLTRSFQVPGSRFQVPLLCILLAAAVCTGQTTASAPTSKPASRPAENLLNLDDGYVTDFLVLAGIPYSVNPQQVKSSGNFIFGESELAPRDGYVFRSDRMSATKLVRWRIVRAKDHTLDLAALGSSAQTVNYVVAYLVAPKAMPVRIEMPGQPLVRLNGQALKSLDTDLAEGHNTLVLRLADDKGDGKVSLRVRTRDGQNIPDLRVSMIPSPEEEEKRLRSGLEADPAFIIFPKQTKRISYLPPELEPKVKQMAGKAMNFIVENQQSNGAWSDTLYPDSVGVSALCCLALMAEGNLPNQGVHGKALDKGLEFLLNSFKEEGVCASSKVEGYGVMYGHALATLALLEAGGNMPWRPEVDDRISKGLQTILRYQRNDGGWRYELSKTGDSDISVTTTVMWVLGQARRYGYSVPRESVDKAMKFVEACGASDGMFMYRLSGKAKVQPHSGVGVAALYGAGRIDHPLLPKARDLIAQEYQRYSVDDLCERQYLLFGSFYAGLCMYSSGYDTWKPWYEKMVQTIEKQQGKDGELTDQSRNKMYTTALGAIILQAPYGYLSLFVQ